MVQRKIREPFKKLRGLSRVERFDFGILAELFVGVDF